MNEFRNMNELVEGFFGQSAFKPVRPAYCDYIAHTIAANLRADDTERFLTSVSRPKYDLSAEGSLASTRKVIQVTDFQGKAYRIIVEEA